MNLQPHLQKLRKGFTLVELSVVIGVLIALTTIGVFFSSAIGDWQAGKEASETLRGVYVAQKSYLADHPTTQVVNLTNDMLIPYLPDNSDTMPQVEGLDGTMKNIKVSVSPPVVVNGDGSAYDPSGNTSDSLWDVGE